MSKSPTSEFLPVRSRGELFQQCPLLPFRPALGLGAGPSRTLLRFAMARRRDGPVRPEFAGDIVEIRKVARFSRLAVLEITN